MGSDDDDDLNLPLEYHRERLVFQDEKTGVIEDNKELRNHDKAVLELPMQDEDLREFRKHFKLESVGNIDDIPDVPNSMNSYGTQASDVFGVGDDDEDNPFTMPQMNEIMLPGMEEMNLHEMNLNEMNMQNVEDIPQPKVDESVMTPDGSEMDQMSQKGDDKNNNKDEEVQNEEDQVYKD